MKKTVFQFFLSISLFAVSLGLTTEVPYLTGRVNDNAQLLSPETVRSLTDMLKSHEEKTGNQIVVLTIPSLEGENIEDYAFRVFNEWKLGQKGKDNGILMVVAPNDRRMRIEVGYGLEGILPDGKVGQIIRNIMAPRFRQGDYDGGIKEGVRAIVELLEGGHLEELEEADKKGSAPHFEIETPNLSIPMRILLGAFIFGIIGLFTAIGIFTPGSWFLYFFLIPFWASFPIVILGVQGALIVFLTYLIGFPIAKLVLKNSEWYKKASADLRTKGTASIGGFTIASGGSGGSWSSGGSSFSGGGGSSGGGGASGSW